MKKNKPMWQWAGFLLVCLPFLYPAPTGSETKPATPWTLNDQEYFEKPGLSVLVFHDYYPEGKQGGIEIIQHGERVAAIGDVRIETTPGQWGTLPTVGRRTVDRAVPAAVVALRFEKQAIEYRIRVEPCGDAICLTVDLINPLPPALAGQVGLNLALFPTAYFSKTYHLGQTFGVFPLQANGPCAGDAGVGLRPVPLAQGIRLVAAPEDPLRRLEIESLTSELRLYDGRDMDTHGWFVVRSLIPAGATTGAVKWRITPNAVPGWRRQPVIGISQVGYHPQQEKRAIIELDPRPGPLGEAMLLRVDPGAGLVPVLTQPLSRWGRFLRYDYAVFDFSSIGEPGSYLVRYGDGQTPPFRIASDVYRRGVWQQTLETFIPVQMCHMRVEDRGRIWHGICHLDDALQAPANYDLADIEGYRQGAAKDTAYADFQHIPGLIRGGWHDAGDYDLAAGSQSWATLMLALAAENFALDSDQTFIDADAGTVQLHVPDAKPDILQQVVHGVQNLLGGYRASGHSFMGITDPSLEQYIKVGDASSLTDNLIYNPALGPGEERGEYSGRRDDRIAFTSRITSIAYRTAAALAAASRILAGFDDSLAKECLATAVKAWEYEQSHPPAYHPSEYVPQDAADQEVLATVELLLATRAPRYRRHLTALLPVIERNIDKMGWMAVRALPLLNNKAFFHRLEKALDRYSADLRLSLTKNPYGVPFRPEIWGVTWDIQSFAVEQYFLHGAFPRLFDRENILRVLNYILGCHPASNTSLVSGVGAHSLTVAYGTNLNEWSHIPGGGVSGPALIRPDFPELKEPFPFLWQQSEYVIGGASTYLFTVLAADRLLNESAATRVP